MLLERYSSTLLSDLFDRTLGTWNIGAYSFSISRVEQENDTEAFSDPQSPGCTSQTQQGFKYADSLNLTMGYYHIELSPNPNN